MRRSIDGFSFKFCSTCTSHFRENNIFVSDLGGYVLFGLLLHCRCEVGFFGSIFSGMELFDISAHDEITEHEKRP